MLDELVGLRRKTYWSNVSSCSSGLIFGPILILVLSGLVERIATRGSVYCPGCCGSGCWFVSFVQILALEKSLKQLQSLVRTGL